MSLVGWCRCQPVPEVECLSAVVQRMHHQRANTEELSGRKRALHRVGQQPCAEPTTLHRPVDRESCK